MFVSESLESICAGSLAWNEAVESYKDDNCDELDWSDEAISDWSVASDDGEEAEIDQQVDLLEIESDLEVFAESMCLEGEIAKEEDDKDDEDTQSNSGCAESDFGSSDFEEQLDPQQLLAQAALDTQQSENGFNFTANLQPAPKVRAGDESTNGSLSTEESPLGRKRGFLDQDITPRKREYFNSTAAELH